MGEAKRRKKLDPKFGKPKLINKITITKSSQTNNYLINIDGYCYDSAISLEDAELIAKQLEPLLIQFPIRHTNEQKLMSWTLEHGDQTTDLSAEVTRLNPDGTISTEFIDFSSEEE